MLESYMATSALKNKENREGCKKYWGEGDTILHRMFSDNLSESVMFKSRPEEGSKKATWIYGVGGSQQKEQ